MEGFYGEQSLDMSAIISKFGQHPVMLQLIGEVNKVHAENPHLDVHELLDTIAQQQQGVVNIPASHVQDENHMETEGLYESNCQPNASSMYESPNKVENHMQYLNLNSPESNQCFTINMDDLNGDPLNVPPRQRPVKNKKRATGRTIAHDHQYSSSSFTNSATLEEPLHQAPVNAGRSSFSQGLIYSHDEVLSHPDYQQQAVSLHPQVAPEMEEIFQDPNTTYLEDCHGNDSFTLDGDSSSLITPQPGSSLFPEDTYNSTTGYMSSLVVGGLKEEMSSPLSVEYSPSSHVQYEDMDPLHFNDTITCESLEPSRAVTPADSFTSNSNLSSPFPQEIYFDSAPTPSPSTAQPPNYDSISSPAPSCSSGYTTPSPSVRGRSRNSSGRRPGRRSRLSSSSSTSGAKEPRMSLVNLTPEEKRARVRDQNNEASRKYRMGKKGKLSDMEAEVHTLEEVQQHKRQTLLEADLKLTMMKKLISEAHRRGMLSITALRRPQ